jgi:PKD repeat protein
MAVAPANPRDSDRVAAPAVAARGRSAHPRRRRLGQAIPEFALLLPVFLLLLLGAVDFGRLFFSYVQITNAAGQGAAYGAFNPTDSVGILAKVRQETNAQAQRGENALTVATACKDSAGMTMACADSQGGTGAGNIITVTVTERFNFLTPLINGIFGNFNLNASASASVAGFAPGTGGAGQTGCTPPTSAAFTYSVTNFGINVDASAAQPDNGQWAISSYLWDMGDGLDPFPPVTGKTASYTYGGAGLYTVSLTVQNQCGSLTSTQSVAIGSVPTPTPSPTPSPTPTPTPAPTPTAPACSMTANFTTTKSGKTVNFFGSSGGAPAPLTWNWTFGDGHSDTGQNVVHTYQSSNGHTVTLTIINGSCQASISKGGYP